MTSIAINWIGSEACRIKIEEGRFDTSPLAGQNLARDIAKLVQKEVINVRIVQPGDNLARIAEGLSQRAIQQIKAEGGVGWEDVTVKYRGKTEEIKRQQEENSDGELMKAKSVYKNQCVYLKDSRTLIVAATFEDLKPEVSTT